MHLCFLIWADALTVGRQINVAVDSKKVVYFSFALVTDI